MILPKAIKCALALPQNSISFEYSMRPSPKHHPKLQHWLSPECRLCLQLPLRFLLLLSPWIPSLGGRSLQQVQPRELPPPPPGAQILHSKTSDPLNTSLTTLQRPEVFRIQPSVQNLRSWVRRRFSSTNKRHHYRVYTKKKARRKAKERGKNQNTPIWESNHSILLLILQVNNLKNGQRLTPFIRKDAIWNRQPRDLIGNASSITK